MAPTTTDTIEARARALAGDGRSSPDVEAAVAELIAAAGGDRGAIEAARNRIARGLHGNASDWRASTALGLLNKALISSGWDDPYDWKIRWSQPFRRP